MKTSLFFVRFQIDGAPMPIASGHVLATGPASAVFAARERLRGKANLDGARCFVRSGLNGDRMHVRQPDDDPLFDTPILQYREAAGMGAAI